MKLPNTSAHAAAGAPQAERRMGALPTTPKRRSDIGHPARLAAARRHAKKAAAEKPLPPRRLRKTKASKPTKPAAAAEIDITPAVMIYCELCAEAANGGKSTRIAAATIVTTKALKRTMSSRRGGAALPTKARSACATSLRTATMGPSGADAERSTKVNLEEMH